MASGPQSDRKAHIRVLNWPPGNSPRRPTQWINRPNRSN